ncbi:hypothetical protein AL755_11925 [Arthrobacter sp. ERGS1:01]|uniref:hypothetical protein n=1 Tax=Arthrobacter sp. ERGS1:01 TaxID=1704044 RepID=UPI0006B56859|nr:hypothetical protein [Arthrobacter sp. ERGS1:01]ALE06017.1 hypothetical protein AL755_11925 [Arthrobacter sp. ERGS1:01]
MTPRGSLLARGWIGAGFATAIAAVSHMLAGGDAPNPLLLLLSLAVSGLVCCLLAGRVLSLGRLVAGVVASQALFHWLFSLSPTPPSESSRMMMTGMDHGHAPDLSALAVHPVVASMGHPGGHGWTMWLGHAAAAALTILFLRYGEVASVHLLDALRLKVTKVLPRLVLPAAAPCRLQARSTSILLPLAELGVPLPVMRHRGPPVHLAAS